MKRVIFLLLTIIVCAATQAQVRFGIRGGLNVSSIVGKDANDYKAKAGLFLGGLAQDITLRPKSVCMPAITQD